MKRTLTIIAIISMVILIPASLYWLCTRPIPALDGSEYCPGLEKSSIVKFDAHAIPYIESYSDLDAYEAQGYVTARERMFQMDMLRRAALGHLCEIYGLDTLQSDRLVRTLGIARLAEAEWMKLTPTAKEVLESYTRGVNAYLANDGSRLSVEFALLGYKPTMWRPQESLAIMKYLAYKMDESWRLDDFRQRVQNRVGEKLATELFRDDLVSYGLPVEKKEEAKPTAPATRKGVTEQRRTPNAIPGSPVAMQQSECPSGRATKANLQHGAETVATLNPGNVLEELAQLGNQVHKADYGQPLWGSTAWVVPAAATKKGNGLLACDKDNAFMVPSEWYLCSLNGPKLHVAGASMPGVPGVIIGRNEKVSWGSAALKADVQDIYLEEFKSQFDTTYKVPGGAWTNAEVRTELIPVRFGSDVEHRIFTTRHGPVLMRVNQAGISISWTGFRTEHPAFESLLQVNKAESIEELNEALKIYSDPAQIFVFADRSGNVGYHVAGDIPIRVGGSQGTMLNTGWENKGAWQGYVPVDKLPQGLIPHSTDTESQKAPIVAANQKPSALASTMPRADNSIFFGHQWQPPYRANRLLAAIKELATNSALSPTEMNQLQGDQFSQLGPLVSKTLQEAALATKYIDRNGVGSIGSLVKWDGQLRGSGAQASVFEAFLQTMMRRSLEPQLGRALAQEYLQRWPLWLTQAEYIMRYKPANMLPPEERTYDTYFLTTLVQAMKSLHISFGTDTPGQWTWAKAHQALFMDWASSSGAWFSRFTRLGPVGVGGSNECVNSCEVKPDQNGLSYWCTSGPTERMVIDMADPDKFYQSIGTGQSEHHFSPYRADQLPAWVKIDLAPIAFSPNQVIRQTQHRLMLVNEFGTR